MGPIINHIHTAWKLSVSPGQVREAGGGHTVSVWHRTVITMVLELWSFLSTVLICTSSLQFAVACIYIMYIVSLKQGEADKVMLPSHDKKSSA